MILKKTTNLLIFKAMKNKVFKIVILDDDYYFNKLITRRIKILSDDMAMDKNIKFEIFTFTNPHDYLENIPVDTNVAFIDFYLGGNINGQFVLESTFKKCTNCKIFIISRLNNFKTSIVPIMNGASGFIQKKNDVLNLVCEAVEDAIKMQGYL